MRIKTIRLRDDQTAFITQVTKERATDLSEFVRLCVDNAAQAVAKQLPHRKTLEKLPSDTQLRTARDKAQKARAA